MKARSQTRTPHVLFVAAECRDIATAGGLGDVVRELSKAIRLRGVRVSIAMPYYGLVTKSAISLGKFKVLFGNRSWVVEWFQCSLDGVTVYLLRKHAFFGGRYKTVYINSLQHPFEDDGRRFAFFSSAVLAFLQDHAPLRSVNTLHCHDWHTGALFILLKYDPLYSKLLERVHTVFTIHNLEYQGIRPFTSRINRACFTFSDWFPSLYALLKRSGTVHDLRNPKPPLRWFNPMRAAIQLADHVTTVSPRYALELTQADNPTLKFSGGRGLEHDIARRKRQRRFHGILNGLDYTIHTPSALRPTYDVTRLGWEKARMKHKHTFISEEWIKRPLIVMVTRAADQKVKMLLEKHHGKPLLEHVLQRNLFLLILATGEREKEINAIVKHHHNGKFICAFDRNLAQRMYAAGDLLLMPSDFEPCGISQLISMRHGCLPLVHGIGGLRDTVSHNTTGFVFNGKTRAQTRQALLETLDAALHHFAHDRHRWRQMQRQAMQARFDWADSIEQYLTLYFDS